MMYKAKIEKINTNSTFNITIPCLKYSGVKAYAITKKGELPGYDIGDLVLVEEVNTNDWVILGYIFGQTK
jgi:predicted transcriptional regulator